MGSTASIRPSRRAVPIRIRRCRTQRWCSASSIELQQQGLHPSPLPLGLLEGCVLCNTCNSFPCKIHAKSDADVCGIKPAVEQGVTLWTNAKARRLFTDASGKRIEAVEVERAGETVPRRRRRWSSCRAAR